MTRNRVWNCDETALTLELGKKRGFTFKGKNNIYNVAEGNNKKHHTGLATMAGDGSPLDPYFVYPYERTNGWVEETI